MITKYTNLVEIPKVSIKNLAEIVRRYNFVKYENAKRLAELYIKCLLSKYILLNHFNTLTYLFILSVIASKTFMVNF